MGNFVSTENKHPAPTLTEDESIEIIRSQIQNTVTTNQVKELLLSIDPYFSSMNNKQKNNRTKSICKKLESNHHIVFIRQPAPANVDGGFASSTAANASPRGQKRQAVSDISPPRIPIASFSNSRLSRTINQPIRENFVTNLSQYLPSSLLGGFASSQQTSSYQDSQQPQLSKARLNTRRNAEIDLLAKYANLPKLVWIVDFEFIMLSKYKCAVPLEMSIRTLDMEIVLHTTIHYNMSTLTLKKTILPYLSPHTNRPNGQNVKYCNDGILKYYKSIDPITQTTGLTVSQIKQVLVGKGFSHDTHKLLCWGMGVDITIFDRILGGSNAVIVDQPPPRQMPINLYEITKAALPDEPPISAKLDSIHPILCPGVKRKYHYADEDVLATIDIVKLLVTTLQ